MDQILAAAAEASTSGLDWGTVPDWLAAIGTIGAFGFGFYLFWNDRRRSVRALADKLAIWPIYFILDEKQHVVVNVHNANDVGIPRLVVRTTDNSADRLKHLFKSGELLKKLKQSDYEVTDLNATIRPGESIVHSFVLENDPNKSLMYASFQDANGRIWARLVGTTKYLSKRKLHRLANGPARKIVKFNERHTIALGGSK